MRFVPVVWLAAFLIHTPAQLLCASESSERYHLAHWEWPKRLSLKKGDRLAICGDSITEQRMYSRIIEDYLTMCAPDLKVTVRQYGWSGEKAGGFLARMTNDCLRFHPTIATTCYGMNDHEYRPYEPRIGMTYLKNMRAIVDAFEANGARVIVGSPGRIGKMPHWVESATGTVDDLNLSLARLRDMGLEMASTEHVGFADVFGPMMQAHRLAQDLYGTNYAISGQDGVHPDWAGQLVMAYAFLRGMGLSGDIGTFRVNLGTGRINASAGHQVVAANADTYTIRSSRYPFVFCLEAGQATAGYPSCSSNCSPKDNNMCSALKLVPFNEHLNRLMLFAKGGKAKEYSVNFGSHSRTYTAQALANGVNLAADFPCNPFADQFAKVDGAVAVKQAYETKQVKEIFHGAEGKSDMEAAVKRTEAEREPLVQAIRAAFQPVTYDILVSPVE